MEQIALESESNYLGFVQINVEARETELETLAQSAATAAASGKDSQDLRNRFRNVLTPDLDNPYFIRVDLASGETRYYGNISLKHKSAEPIPVTHPGIEEILIFDARSDGKGYRADYRHNLPDLVARTHFIIKNGKIEKIVPEIFDADSSVETVIAKEVVEHSIQQTRQKKMKPISSTLQPDQFKITSEPASHSLAIQGPPGSGKTAVLLERLARIAFADEGVYKKGMLLIGPSSQFMAYVSSVLPTLGETEISMRSIDQLSEFSKQVNSPALENELLLYLKGCYLMPLVLENTVEQQAKVLSKSVFMKIQDIGIDFTAADSLKLLEELKKEGHTPFAQLRRVGENRIRNILVSKFNKTWIDRYGDLRRLQIDPAIQISQDSAFRTIVRNLFPTFDAVTILGKLKSDANVFLDASNDVFDLEDQLIWLEGMEVESSKITPTDIPILDYLHALISETPRRWGHIAIDEGQDLTPMQMGMIARRLDVEAAVSIAGDLAQATGTQYYESWENVLLLLEQEQNFVEKQLTRSYRVPSEILSYAKQFLLDSRVNVAASEPFLHREGALSYLQTSNSAQAVSDAVVLGLASLQAKESLLIIASSEDREQLSKHSFPDNEGAYVKIMNPIDVKGLEFDAVIIVNPEKIVDEYPWEKSRLARLFYVLSTRSTKRLCLIGSDMQYLQRPLYQVEESAEPEIDSEINISANTAEAATESIAPTSSATVPTAIVEAPKSTVIPPNHSILDICSDLNIPITQASGDFLVGEWLFAGNTQARCSECGEKPQLTFTKHIAREGRAHQYALGCPGCFVIRSYDPQKFGDIELIIKELNIPKLTQDRCTECRGG